MPRIRTVKPEFWSHPILARAPDETRLAAIGLLNYADDEGYFLAEPAAVRSFIWPLDDDSSKARRTIANLSRIGYIEVVETAEHGPIGRVVNFDRHQRVDRANQSKLKDYFDSSNDRRSIDDQSLLEQGREQGTGNRERKSARTRAAPAPRPGVDYTPGDAVRAWAKDQGFLPYLDLHVEKFRDTCATQKRGAYRDLDAAFRNCCRDDWGNVRRQAKDAERRGDRPPAARAAPKACARCGNDGSVHVDGVGLLCAEHFDEHRRSAIRMAA